MIDKEREKEIIQHNIVSAKNLLLKTEHLNMGSQVHDIRSTRAKLEYSLEKTEEMDSMENDYFKHMCKRRMLLESMYFQENYLKETK